MTVKLNVYLEVPHAAKIQSIQSLTTLFDTDAQLFSKIQRIYSENC